MEWQKRVYKFVFVWFQIEPLLKEAQIVSDMYELIEKYSVPAPPEDFAVYLVGV